MPLSDFCKSKDLTRLEGVYGPKVLSRKKSAFGAKNFKINEGTWMIFRRRLEADQGLKGVAGGRKCYPKTTEPIDWVSPFNLIRYQKKRNSFNESIIMEEKIWVYKFIPKSDSPIKFKIICPLGIVKSYSSVNTLNCAEPLTLKNTIKLQKLLTVIRRKRPWRLRERN